MREFILELDNGNQIVRNLKSTWVQRCVNGPGWMLCYEDYEWDRHVIYKSSSRETLLKLQAKMIDAYKAGEKGVRL